MRVKGYIQELRGQITLLNEQVAALSSDTPFAQIAAQLVEIDKILNQSFVSLKGVAQYAEGVAESHLIAKCGDLAELKGLLLFASATYDPANMGTDPLIKFGILLKKFAVAVDRLKTEVSPKEQTQNLDMSTPASIMATAAAALAGGVLGAAVAAAVSAAAPVIAIGVGIGALTGGGVAQGYIGHLNGRSQAAIDAKKKQQIDQNIHDIETARLEMNESLKNDFLNFNDKLTAHKFPPELLNDIMDPPKKSLRDKSDAVKDDPIVEADASEPLGNFEKALHECAKEKGIAHEFKDAGSDRQCILKSTKDAESAIITHKPGGSKASLKFTKDATAGDPTERNIRGEVFITALINSTSPNHSIALTFKNDSQSIELATAMINILEREKRPYTLNPAELAMAIGDLHKNLLHNKSTYLPKPL